MLIGLQSRQPSPLPFSDWKARVERIIQHKTGWCLTLKGFGLESYYNAGISPLEAAEDWIATC